MRARVYRDKGELIGACIGPDESVLDIGFFGQGITARDPHSAHQLLKARAREVWGLDLDYDESILDDPSRYVRGSADSFSVGRKFDVIFAGDLIEHLSNPGLFLGRAKAHLNPGGRLVLTTPNAFNLFNLAEKFSKDEPTVNFDHTCYFNSKTLRTLLEKNGWTMGKPAFLYSLGALHKESWKKKFLNAWYALFARFTPKFLETLVVVARPQ